MSNFRYDTTVQLIKGKDASGKDKMLMKGVASSTSKDTDGHSLNPTGFDTSYFLEKGFINWNHEWKKSPASIVGRPDKAFVNDKNELEIEYSLFKGHKMAEEIYQLAGVLEQNDIFLGLSIEGEVVATDPNDKNKITKAKITDCAITPHPKNSGTVTSIIKGNNFEELVDFDKLGAFEVASDGRLIVKSTTTEVVDDLMPESLETKEKNKKRKEMAKETLTKSEVFVQLKQLRPTIQLQEAEAIFAHTVKLQKSLDMNQEIQKTPEVSNEAFEKAMETLGLSKGTETTPAPAAAPTETPAAAQPAGELEKGEKGEKMEKSHENMTDEEKKVEKGKKMEKSYESMTDEEKKMEKGKLKKSLEALEALDKDLAPTETSSSANSELVKAVSAAIIEGQESTNKLVTEKTQALGTLVNQTMEFAKGLQGEILQLKGQPLPTRAVTTQNYTAKPGEELEKGASGEILNGQMISVSQERSKLATTLTDAALEKANGNAGEMDSKLKSGLVALEGFGHVTGEVMEFAKSLNIQIIE